MYSHFEGCPIRFFLKNSNFILKNTVESGFNDFYSNIWYLCISIITYPNMVKIIKNGKFFKKSQKITKNQNINFDRIF